MLLLDVEIKAHDEEGNTYVWAMGTHVKVIKEHKVHGYYQEIKMKEKDLKEKILDFKERLKEVIK